MSGSLVPGRVPTRVVSFRLEGSPFSYDQLGSHADETATAMSHRARAIRKERPGWTEWHGVWWPPTRAEREEAERDPYPKITMVIAER